MATIKEATDKFVKEFLVPNKGVYGVGHFPCSCCDKPYIEVSMNTNDKELVSKIPDKFMGFRVEKKYGEQSVAQIQKTIPPVIEAEKDKFKKEFEGKDGYVIDITKKGRHVINNSPIVGGYIPEDIGILLEVQQKPKTISALKNAQRKFDNLEGLLIYLHTKGLVSINGITSPKAEDFSNVRGGRRPAPRRRVAPRRRTVVRRTVVRRGGGRRGGYYGWGVYPYAVLPAYAYYYNVGNPNRIKITDKGLKYLALNPQQNIYTYFLSAVASGLIYDERNLYNTLKLGQDYNDVAGWLYGNKLITFA
jgi:hypothetical protein